MRLLLQFLFLALPLESRDVGEHPNQMVGLPAVQQRPRNKFQSLASNSSTSASTVTVAVDSRAGEPKEASFAGTSLNSKCPGSSSVSLN